MDIEIRIKKIEVERFIDYIHYTTVFYSYRIILDDSVRRPQC